MFEYIGEKVRDGVLSGLPWISRSAGYTEPAMSADSGMGYPGATPYAGAPCSDHEDYLNMAPQDGETCIAFVDTEDEVRSVRSNTRFSEIETFFRVVVWFDSRKVAIDGDSFFVGLQMAVNSGVSAIDFNTDGLSGARARFFTYQADPERIWGRYKLSLIDGLFARPYRTFAIKFRLTARYRPECFTGLINADADAC